MYIYIKILAIRAASRRQTLSRVWSRPAREKPLLGLYDSPHSSDDDGDDVNNDQLDRGQRLDYLEANMSAEDDEELNGDDVDRSDNCMVSVSVTYNVAMTTIMGVVYTHINIKTAVYTNDNGDKKNINML